MKAITYKLIEDYGAPGIGMTITDFWYNLPNGGGTQYPVLQKAGDFIDLNLIDFPTFCRSACHGILHTLIHDKGLMTPVKQEVPDWTAERLAREMELTRNPFDRRPKETFVYELEPGIQIAMARQPEPPKALPPPPKEEGLEEVGEVREVTLGKSKDTGSEESEEVAGIETEEAESSWKANMDWAQQKAIINTSEDVKFLKAVAGDKEESVPMRNLAKYRLTLLKSPVGGKE